MLRTLMDKVDSMQKQMGNESIEIRILRKNQKEVWKIKYIVTDMKNALGGLIIWLPMAEERIPELKDISMQTFKSDKEREQRLKNETKESI